MIARSVDFVIVVLGGILAILLLPIVAPIALCMAIWARLGQQLMGDMKGGCKR